jgi:hypothetical protein
MATQTNVPQSLNHSKLAVVPLPAPQTISQLALQTLVVHLVRLDVKVEFAEQSVRSRLGSWCTAAVDNCAIALKYCLHREIGGDE